MPRARFQLQPAPADIPELLQQLDLGVVGNAVTRLVRLLSVNQNVAREDQSLGFVA